MQSDNLHDYHAALTEIEALWDTGQTPENSKRIKALVQSAEDYEHTNAPANPPPTVPSLTDWSEDQPNLNLMNGLSKPLMLQAFIGWRSATAALRACRLLMMGNAPATAIWMNRKFYWCEFTPLELAEQDDSGLQMVLDEIGRIDAGVFA